MILVHCGDEFFDSVFAHNRLFDGTGTGGANIRVRQFAGKLVAAGAVAEGAPCLPRRRGGRKYLFCRRRAQLRRRPEVKRTVGV